MMAVIAQESVNAHCLVIGEDLGTVPEGFREVMADWGVWTYRVALFERNSDGTFVPSHDYPERALVSFNTHDMATFKGWLTGHDIDAKRAVGVDPGEDMNVRRDSHRLICDMLERSGLGRELNLPTAVRFMARTASRLLVVSAEDILGVTEQPNMPGTIDEHPNWRRKLPVDLADIAERSSLRTIAEVLAHEGRSSAGR
jgi:4-alpha-glucanotransferase